MQRSESMRYISVMIVVALLIVWGEDLPAAASRPEASPPATKRVLILYSLDGANPSHKLTEAAIHAVLAEQDEYTVEIFSEYVDSSRFAQPPDLDTLARFLTDKYTNTRPDLVITVLPFALAFILEYGGRLFSDIPIVACSIFESSVEELVRSGSRRKTTGVVFRDDIGDIVELMKKLLPNLTRITLVGGASGLDLLGLVRFRRALEKYQPEFEIVELSGPALAEIVAEVSTLPKNSAILYASFTLDGQGQRFVSREALQTISRAANVPVFGLFDIYFGYGIVGGDLFSLENQGRSAAELALQIFAGTKPEDIPFIRDNFPLRFFDWRELQRWGIEEKNLPEGSSVYHRENSVWQQYRGRIIAVLLLLTFMTVLIISLVISLQREKRMRQELDASAQRYQTVADYAYAWEYWTAADGALNYISPACESITGYPPGEFIDNPALLHMLIVAEDEQVWQEHNHDARNSPETKQIFFRIRRADGQTRWIEHTCRAVIAAGGEFLGIRASNRDITARYRAEKKIRESEQDLQKLTQALIHAQEEERRRLARELHDDFAQRMAVLAMKVGSIEQNVTRDSRLVAAEFDELRRQAMEISRDMHDISRQLHPAMLDDLGLVKAIEAEFQRVSRREGLDVDFYVEDIPDILPENVALSLYRIVQEGLTNIARHACADRVEISLRHAHGELLLVLRDNGIGLDFEQVRKRPGLGLSSMRERAKIIRGTLQIDSAPSAGTTITVRVVLTEVASPESDFLI